MPLSNDVIQKRISDLSRNILDQVIADVRDGPLKISLQLHKTTNVENCSQLIALAKYIHDGFIIEDFLFCKELKRTTKRKDVFQCVKNFFVKHDLDIQIIGSVCTECAPAMPVNNSGFFALLK